MNKFLLSVLMFVLATITANAQNKNGIPVKNWETELRIGGTLPLSGNNNSTALLGPALGAEVRYNKDDSPFSFGAKMELTVASKDIQKYILTMPEQEEETIEMGYRTINFSALCDYNFRQGHNVNPFIGLGLGMGIQHEYKDGFYEEKGHTALIATPRVGVELFRHLRVTCNATITKKNYSNIGITLGYVFGGGKK